MYHTVQTLLLDTLTEHWFGMNIKKETILIHRCGRTGNLFPKRNCGCRDICVRSCWFGGHSHANFMFRFKSHIADQVRFSNRIVFVRERVPVSVYEMELENKVPPVSFKKKSKT